MLIFNCTRTCLHRHGTFYYLVVRATSFPSSLSAHGVGFILDSIPHFTLRDTRIAERKKTLQTRYRLMCCGKGPASCGVAEWFRVATKMQMDGDKLRRRGEVQVEMKILSNVAISFRLFLCVSGCDFHALRCFVNFSRSLYIFLFVSHTH